MNNQRLGVALRGLGRLGWGVGLLAMLDELAETGGRHAALRLADELEHCAGEGAAALDAGGAELLDAVWPVGDGERAPSVRMRMLFTGARHLGGGVWGAALSPSSTIGDGPSRLQAIVDEAERLAAMVEAVERGDTGDGDETQAGGAIQGVSSPVAMSPEDDDAAPALTESQARVLDALRVFPAARLAGVPDIAANAGASEGTAKAAVRRLIELGLAERPGGDRSGARLTMKGRRLASKIAP